MALPLNRTKHLDGVKVVLLLLQHREHVVSRAIQIIEEAGEPVGRRQAALKERSAATQERLHMDR
eukprot:1045181-Prymnesium_polylepis.1